MYVKIMIVKRKVKVIILIAILTGIQSMAYAQSFHLGIKGGANMNKIDGLSFKDSYKLGYHLGGFMEIDFVDAVGIQPEVLFNQTNTKVTDRVSDVFRPEDIIHLNYLSIPILLRINAGKILTINAGPQYSILINNRKSAYGNVRNAFKSGDFSLVGGLQLNLEMFRIYGRYAIGLSDVNDINNQDKWKSQTIHVGVGLAIF